MSRDTRTQIAERLDAQWSAQMVAAQAGDRIAYLDLLRGCAPLIRRVVRRQGVHTDRIDDVTQEILLTLHRARQTYDAARSFSAWLCTIAQRRAIDSLRLPGLAFWIAGTSMGCLRAWTIPGAGVATVVEAWTCFTFIMSLSAPLSALMIRRACPLRPNLTAVTGGLAVAAGAATMLNFFHSYDAGATDITAHVVAIALVIGANRLFGSWLLQSPVFRRGM